MRKGNRAQHSRALQEAPFEELQPRLLPRNEALTSAPPLPSLVAYLENQNRLVEFERVIAAGDDAVDPRAAELQEWRDYLGTLQRQVCRVDIRGTRSGTAFLIAQDLVLTAYTVVKRLIEGDVTPRDVRFRFDLWPTSNGEVLDGISYRLTEPLWLIDRSPPDRLNFAVLRLSPLPCGAERLGAVTLRPGGRGYLPLPEVARSYLPGAPLFLVHHPGDGGIRLSMSCYAMKRVARDGSRFTHAINAERGSIGGPLFDSTGALVAIHEGLGRVGNRTAIIWNAILRSHDPLGWIGRARQSRARARRVDADSERVTSIDGGTLPPRLPTKKHIILFLAANPSGTDPRALDREARAIQLELERSGFRDSFELVTRWAAEPLDLLRELRRLKPTVVHFSGRGAEPHQGLFFHGSDGRARLISTVVLEETFGAAGASVQLVVLDACYSEMQARALLTHVDCVVGMGGAILDEAARGFAIGFYGGLGDGESVADAYRQGCVAISLEGLSEDYRPRLQARVGVDAARLVLAGTSGAKFSSDPR